MPAPDAPAAAAKAALRAEMRAVRRAITADPLERARRSSRIWAGIVPLFDLGGQRPGSGTLAAQFRSVMLFEGTSTEPDTAPWLADARARGIAVYVPDVDGPALRVVPGDVDPAVLDAVVVPGLAFTPDGRRLGQGGGHYDRFLARLRPDCVTIGACFAEQVVAHVPTDAHDRRVDHVVTDA